LIYVKSEPSALRHLGRMRLFRPLVVAMGFAFACAALAGEPQSARRAALVDMVRQDCGSCHGLTLKGGLGPPLLPAALADKDVEQLRFVILNGRPGTAMPPWRPFLSEAEARWIVEMLRTGFPE
jgi:cytochrome c55X